MRAGGWRLARPWLLLLAVGLAAAWLRYGLIESRAMGQLCSGVRRPSWCSGRQLLVLGFLHDVYGDLALAAAAWALVWKRPWTACLAAALGVFALELYCFQAGALALLIGCLSLLRWQAQALPRLPPTDQHRQREQQVQSQP
ncbi:MAG: hypothetical protein KGJ97_11865 [Xanthomonadaceae bacterium]|nr:hypothetical protein [Xanthomonadaceae bacterium]MDE3072473.1 hypothetical protein [Pseudomonadota bacterium]